jgi:hypothetical protein
MRRFYNVVRNHTVTGYCYGVVSYNASHVTATIYWSPVLPHLSSNHSRFIHQTYLLWLQQTHLVAKRGGTWREIPWQAR